MPSNGTQVNNLNSVHVSSNAILVNTTTNTSPAAIVPASQVPQLAQISQISQSQISQLSHSQLSQISQISQISPITYFEKEIQQEPQNSLSLLNSNISIPSLYSSAFPNPTLSNTNINFNMANNKPPEIVKENSNSMSDITPPDSVTFKEEVETIEKLGT